MAQLAEVVITDDQAALLGAAADATLRADEGGDYIVLEEQERESLKQLAVFMAAVADEPSRFPPTGKMATSLKKRMGVKGPAQPKPQNKRKARQAKRRAFQKLRRQHRREIVAEFNELQGQFQQDQAERQARAAELAQEDTFDIVDLDGNVVMQGVPRSMIRGDVAYQPTPLDRITSGDLVLPASVERALDRAGD